MDDWAAKHMSNWVRRTFPAEAYDTVIDLMLAFLDDYPDLVDKRSWPEIEALARRRDA